MNRFSIHLQVLCESPVNFGTDQLCAALQSQDQRLRSKLFLSLAHEEEEHLKLAKLQVDYEFWFDMTKTLAGFLAAMDNTDLDEFIAML